MNLKSIVGLALLFAVGLTSCKRDEQASYAYLYKDLPFDMPVLTPPVFPNNEVSIKDFGGMGNGINLNTDAFAKAIDHLSQKGGGRLVVPSGVWFTGPIVLKSNINLHLEDKAIILFSPDKSLYPIVETSFEGLDTKRCQSPISSRNTENVAITGSGAIDGNGHYWRPLKKQKVNESIWAATIARGGAFKRSDYWMPSDAYVYGDAIAEMNVPRTLKTQEEWEALRDFLRPVMVSFIECKNVFLQGVIFQNSPAWNVHPLMCENFIMDGVQVRNPQYAQNGDGLDLESCKNSIIVNSTFDVGDDGICVKSGKNEDGRKRARACENLIVNNCTVFKGHGGFVVGSEMSGGVKNVSVTNCQFLGTDVGLRFKSSRGRGGVVENIHISDISMFDIATEPILFNLYYGGKSAVETLEDGDEIEKSEELPLVDETTPAFKDIYIKDVACSNARRALYFYGLPEQNIDNINVENITVYAKIGAEIMESTNIKLKNIQIYPEKGPALYMENVNNVTVEGFETNYNLETIFEVAGKRTANVDIVTLCDSEKLTLAKEVAQNAVSLHKPN
ncbi:glycoside hydrolase family 28 protein [Bacteroides sp. 214]|uniref:glycoside hydrolase family 28 protein n=1 Tax=Bacteroides sp. 214 TaxID=2302935 RepID=UPI0013D4DFEB|nr:glycoside hydrolase family 28 protein [Bacteroides sp. 214]NDW12979.1 glycoside hydrolase family 28 protein [Bacteroides sp. 214]